MPAKAPIAIHIKNLRIDPSVALLRADHAVIRRGSQPVAEKVHVDIVNNTELASAQWVNGR